MTASGRLGFCAPAFANADFGAPSLQTGAIAGGFFNSNALAPLGIAGMPPPTVSQAMQGPDRCGPAVAAASTSHNLPAGLLNAIAVVESGRLDLHSGSMKPWPWTIDANGTAYMYASAQAAIQAASGFQAAGITSLDIGCLQINLAQHPDAFQNLAEAFDPAANANYAAAFLTTLEQKFGNWPQAVAAYHSQTPALGGPYAARVYAKWQGASATPIAPPPASIAMIPAEPPQAILPQTAFEMSSLIPPTRMLTRPNGMTGRSLASYRATPITIATTSAPPPG